MFRQSALDLPKISKRYLSVQASLDFLHFRTGRRDSEIITGEGKNYKSKCRLEPCENYKSKKKPSKI